MDFLEKLKEVKAKFDNINVQLADPENLNDQRVLVNSKRKTMANLDPYIQVFESKYDFISNLSILDLLFNKGPSALEYLQHQKFI